MSKLKILNTIEFSFYKGHPARDFSLHDIHSEDYKAELNKYWSIPTPQPSPDNRGRGVRL